MIKLKNVYKTYNNDTVLKNINLNFEEKGLVVILGKSGSGKSTLLNIIGGLLKPTKGEVIINETNFNNIKRKQDYYANYFGYVFQDYNLFMDMTVYDNVTLNQDKNIDDLLSYLDLYKYKDTLVSKLSGGQMQRVAIARALVNDPKVLLCDEPTGALDSKTGESIMQLLSKISEEHLVIVVTHNIDYAKKYGDKIIEIKDGLVNTNDEEVISEPLIISKSKISFKKIYKIVMNNFRRKKKRNILTIIAFMVGFISLSFVLGIKNGFNESLENEEKASLGTYPIYISKYSKDLDQELKNAFASSTQKEGAIYISNEEHINEINESYINYLDNYKGLDKVFGYNYENTYILTTNNDKLLNSLECLEGRSYHDKGEVALVLNNYNEIDPIILKSIGLNEEKYDYKDLIDYEYKINKEKYIIKGIYKIKEDDVSKYISGLYYYNIDIKTIPDDIYLYAKNYQEKNKLKKYLNKYQEIEYSDYATTIKNLSKTVVNSISVILIVFSVISFIILIIMIAILSYISIIERIKEIGILKANGFSNNHVKLIFYLENIVIVWFSSVFSIELVDIGSLFINKLLESITGLKDIIKLSYGNMLSVLLIGIIIALIGSFIPIKKVKKYDIVDTLKYV